MGTEIGRGALKKTAKADKKLLSSNRPWMYQVYILNDDYTPMDFVVVVLQEFFRMAYPQAVKVMMDIHQRGKAVCGFYTRDIAETKVAQVNEFARANEHPLLCKMEKSVT